MWLVSELELWKALRWPRAVDGARSQIKTHERLKRKDSEDQTRCDCWGPGCRRAVTRGLCFPCRVPRRPAPCCTPPCRQRAARASSACTTWTRRVTSIACPPMARPTPPPPSHPLGPPGPSSTRDPSQPGYVWRDGATPFIFFLLKFKFKWIKCSLFIEHEMKIFFRHTGSVA